MKSKMLKFISFLFLLNPVFVFSTLISFFPLHLEATFRVSAQNIWVGGGATTHFEDFCVKLIITFPEDIRIKTEKKF